MIEIMIRRRIQKRYKSTCISSINLNNITRRFLYIPKRLVTADVDDTRLVDGAYSNGKSLNKFFGIVSHKVEKKSVYRSLLLELPGHAKDGMTFKISSKRSDHNWVVDDSELNQTLGCYIFLIFQMCNSNEKYDINLVEFEKNASAVWKTIRGAGGLLNFR